MQKTLVLLKPDCVERRLIGEIIGRFENKGLNVVAMKMLRVTPALSKQHYAEHVSKSFYPNLESFITSSPIVALALEGLEAIRVVRDMLGATNGLRIYPDTRWQLSSERRILNSSLALFRNCKSFTIEYSNASQRHPKHRHHRSR